MSAEQDLKYGSIVYKEVEISHDEYLEQKYQHVSSTSEKHFAKICYHGSTIHPEKTYTDSYCKKNNLGKYANGGSSSKESEKVDKSTSSGGTESFWIKLLFTIIPLLPIWWLIKLPFKFVIVKLKSIINAIFCGCCSDGGDSEWPAYSFIKF